MRRALTALLTIVALLAVAAPALGATVTTERAQQEIDQSRVILGQSLDALKAGDRDKAYALARSGLPRPLRVRRDPAAPAQPEPRARHRVQVREAAQRHPRRRVRRPDPLATRPIVRAALVDVDRELAKKGVAAPLVAFGFSFSILFREGVEAVLLIAILLGSLAAGQRVELQAAARAAASARRSSRPASCSLLATLVIDIAPLSRELLEAVTALIAVVVLIGGELLARLAARAPAARWSSCARAWRARWPRARRAAFVGLGFTAVFREGFETVLFYQALALFAEGLEPVGRRSARSRRRSRSAASRYAILRLGKQLPLKPMLIAGASVLLLLSVAFVGNAVRSLQSADCLAATPVAHPRLPVFLAELTGIHPTRQGLLVQARAARDLRPRRALGVRVAAGAPAPRVGDGDGVAP